MIYCLMLILYFSKVFCDDIGEKPLLFRLVPDRIACTIGAKYDSRCTKVLFYWDNMRKGIPIYMFDFGLLRFYAHRYRMYRSYDYDLVEFLLQRRWQTEVSHFEDQNRLVLFYDRTNDYSQGRGWISFVVDDQYFSFNFIYSHMAHCTLSLQNHGNQDTPQWWDITWRSLADIYPGKYPFPGLPYQLDEFVPFGSRSKTKPTYDPEREKRLNLKASDGLFQYVLGQYIYNYPLRHQFLLLQGHRDSRNFAVISVTFKFTWKILGNVVHRLAIPMVASRMINELNGILKRSGTLIRLYIACIQISTIADIPNMTNKERLDSYGNPDERLSNDLLIAVVHEMEYNTMGFPYAMHQNKSVIIVKSTHLFEIYDIAHELGHILGAGHTPDKVDPEYKPIVFYGQGYISNTRKCTVMSPPTLDCIPQPLFSNQNESQFEEEFGNALHDNGRWMKQNRFVLQLMGNQNLACPKSLSLGYSQELVRCLITDVTDPSSMGDLLACKEDKDTSEVVYFSPKRPRYY